jgi:hypothetical protein
VVGQLQQCQRAARLVDDAVTDHLVERIADRGGHERPRLGVVEAGQAKLGQPGERMSLACPRVAQAERQGHSLG